MSTPQQTQPTPAAHAAGEGEDLGFELPTPPRGSRVGIFVAIALVIGAGFAFGYFRKHSSKTSATADSAPAAKAIRVEVIKPTVLSSDRALSLPGTVLALEESRLFARVQGYVKAWHADIGDKVTAGQLLVEIDTPEVAAELAQARAQLLTARAAVKQATAQADFSRSNSNRYTTLADQQLVAKMQVEETTARAATDQATVTAAESNVTAMEANVRRLSELVSFSKVTAPFSGTVTSRSVQRGALVMPGASGGQPMMTVSAMDPVRIYLDVPQTIAPSVKADTAATVSVREYGDRKFDGKVTRFAGALDAQLHTMTTEVQVPNADGALFPGMFVQAALTLPIPHKVLEIPSTALYQDAGGLRVAVVDSAKRVKLVKITIERDTGATLQVATGLDDDDQLIKIAVPSLRDGDTVETFTAPPPGASKPPPIPGMTPAAPAAGSGSAK